MDVRPCALIHPGLQTVYRSGMEFDSLRPPKRHGEEDGVSQRNSPKRPRSSADPIGPFSRPGSTSSVETHANSPLPPPYSQCRGPNLHSDTRSVSILGNATQDDVLPMDWAPTLLDGGHNANSEAEHLICYGAVRKSDKNNKKMSMSDTGLLSYARPKPVLNLPAKQNSCYYQATEDSISSTSFAPARIMLYQLGPMILLPSST